MEYDRPHWRKVHKAVQKILRGMWLFVIPPGVFVFFFGNPLGKESDFFFAMPLAMTGVLVLISCVGMFVFHLDPMFINSRYPNLLQLAFISKREPDEEDVLASHSISGAFDRIRPVFHASLSVELTNKRMIVRTIASFPGICLKEIFLSDLAEVKAIPYPGFLLPFQSRPKGLRFKLQNDSEAQFLMLYPRNVSQWTESLRELGVRVSS